MAASRGPLVAGLACPSTTPAPQRAVVGRAAKRRRTPAAARPARTVAQGSTGAVRALARGSFWVPYQWRGSRRNRDSNCPCSSSGQRPAKWQPKTIRQRSVTCCWACSPAPRRSTPATRLPAKRGRRVACTSPAWYWLSRSFCMSPWISKCRVWACFESPLPTTSCVNWAHSLRNKLARRAV